MRIKRKNLQVKRIVILFVVLVVFGAIYTISPKPQPRFAPPPTTPPRGIVHEIKPPTNSGLPIVTPTNVKLSSTESYIHEQGNLKLIRERGWNIAPVSSVASPKDFSGLEFAFRKSGTSCVLGFYSDGNNDNYKQTRVGYRVMTKSGDQIDMWWWVHKDELPQGYNFSFQDQQKMSREVSIGGYNGRTVALFNEDGGVVPEICASEVGAMLTSLEDYYSMSYLDKESVGFVFLGSLHNNIGAFFVAKDKPMTKIVDVETYFDVTPILHNNLLYYVQEDGMLYTLDLFTKKIEQVPNIFVRNSQVINAFKIVGDKIYYLMGKPCNEYRARCDNELYEHDMTSHRNIKLAEHSGAREVLGVDINTAELGLMYSDGDAGCGWASFEVYDFERGALRKVSDFSSCSGDPDYEETYRSMQKLQDRFKPQDNTSEYILVNKGSVLSGAAFGKIDPTSTRGIFPLDIRY